MGLDRPAQQLDPDGKTLLYGLTVDPQWPTLFGQKRNASELFHLYKMNLTSRSSQLLGHIPSKGQVIKWQRGGGRLAVMRLHRFWGLGHRQLEVFTLPAL